MKYVFILMSVLLGLQANGQVCRGKYFDVYCMAKHNILYPGIPNTLQFLQHIGKFGKLFISSDAGQLEETEFTSNINGQQLAFLPSKIGIGHFYVSKVIEKGGKIVDTMIFNVAPLPDPVITLGGKEVGNLNANFAKILIGPAATWPSYLGEFDCKIMVDSFTVVVLRKNKVAFTRSAGKPTGAIFDEEIRTFFKSLQQDDKLVIAGIVCRTPDNIRSHPHPIEFTIVEDKGIKVSEDH